MATYVEVCAGTCIHALPLPLIRHLVLQAQEHVVKLAAAEKGCLQREKDSLQEQLRFFRGEHNRVLQHNDRLQQHIDDVTSKLAAVWLHMVHGCVPKSIACHLQNC